MVRIGIVGIGFMGRIHFLAAQRLRDARVTAICSRDPTKLAGDWSSTRGNFGPEPGRVDLTAVRTYTDYAAMLADPEIDLIDVCNPTDLHPDFASQALNAGKHVLVEKAIALDSDRADQMLETARRANRMLMVAHVLPFFPEFGFAVEAVRSGRYGRLRAAHFKRVIAKPDWSAEIADASKTGGPAVDLHVHDTHFIALLCGVPPRLVSTGTIEGDAVTYLTTVYLYGPEGPAVSCTSGAIAATARPFVHGFELYLERATITHDSEGIPLTVHGPDGTTRPTLPGGGDPINSFALELQAAVEGVRSGVLPDLLSGQLARDALVLCYREIESVRTGRMVEV